jgi:hypothetical protein
MTKDELESGPPFKTKGQIYFQYRTAKIYTTLEAAQILVNIHYTYGFSTWQIRRKKDISQADTVPLPYTRTMLYK